MSDYINVDASYRDTYSITIGFDLWEDIIRFLNTRFSPKTIVVVIDERVLALHGNRIIPLLEKSFHHVVQYVVPSGEEHKNMRQFSKILDVVLKEGIERKTPMLAIGGGVTGDLAGFAAASALRGIPLVHVSATLLAMVDSSIGGKTGVNHETGKNLIGAFYQPAAVFSDLKFLETLPKKEWIGGLSEILKYGFISDTSIFTDLEALIVHNDFAPAEHWQNMIFKCASIKADIIAKDVKESGIREFLNFGHTFAHVIEKIGDYTAFTHGEAVYMGMLAAVYVSNQLGAGIDEDILLKFKTLYNLKLSNSLNRKNLTTLMLHDKKVVDSTIRLILLKNPEQPFSQKFKDKTLLDNAWDYIIKEFD